MVIAGISILALLQRLAFYVLGWSRDQGDTRVDALPLVVSHALIESPRSARAR
jgi:hypothetical protein